MMLRLVLVGMVAALGVTIPSQPGGGQWFNSAEAWATSLLAEWDTWEPTDGDTSGLPRSQDPISCEVCRLARLRVTSKAMLALNGEPPAPKDASTVSAMRDTTLAARAWWVAGPDGDEIAAVENAGELAESKTDPLPSMPKAGDLVAFESPSALDLAEYEIAYELDQLSEAFETAAPPAIETVPAPTASEPVSVADSIELGVWGELYRIVAEPTGAAKSPAIATSVGSDGYDGETLSCLDEEWDLAGCFDETPAPAGDLRVVADLPQDVFTPAPIEASVPAPIAGERVEVAQAAPVASAAKAVVFPDDVFAHPSLDQRPLEANHPVAGMASQPPRLGDAVELTRRAVSAWVSVLIGPALVDGSRR